MLIWAVVALVSLPGSASVKAALVVFGFLILLLSRRLHPLSGALGLAIAALVAVWYLVSRSHGVEPAARVDQAARLVIFFLVLACAGYLHPTFANQETLDRVCRSVAYTAALIKVAITVAVIAFGFSLQEVQNWFGFETVTSAIGFDIQRLQFPSDFVITFLVGCYCGSKSRKVDSIFILAISIVVLLSFSRFIFACFFAAVIVRSIWIRRVDFIPKLAIVAALLTLVVFADSIVERFVGEGSAISDDIRVEQAEQLSQQIQLAPIMGQGFGASVPSYFRSESQPYSYELQWYANLMQFGVAGTAYFILCLASIIFRRIRSTRAVICATILFLLWFAAGLTNPFLTSLGSAVGLSLLAWRSTFSPPTPLKDGHIRRRFFRPRETSLTSQVR